MRSMVVLVALSVGVAACGDDVTPSEQDFCMIQALPLSGEPNAPTVTDVGLEIQPGEGVIIVAWATDPQGDDNLRDVLQSVGVFPDPECQGTPLTLMDDLVGSGVEETFGTAVSVAENPTLYAEIEAAISWPVQVDFVDADVNRTSGRVLARIIR